MKYGIITVLAITALICGCIDLPGNEKQVGTLKISLSKGGIVPIGFKQYTEAAMGNKTDFLLKLQSGRTYIFLMDYVDEVESGKSAKKFQSRYNSVDYDLFLLDSNESILRDSTESAGLGERIVFSPAKTDNYTLRILNDRKESKGSWPVVVLSAEYFEKSKQTKIHIKGKDTENQQPDYETYYALWLEKNPYSLAYFAVPTSIDMYQVRVLCIYNNNFLNTNLHQYYDIASTAAPTNNDYASCSTFGEDMELNLTKSKGKDCVLQFIGEWGEGDLFVNFS